VRRRGYRLPLRKTVGENSDQVLEQFGYRQELKRTLGYFSAFALSFSVISVTTGLFANYGLGLQLGGPAFGSSALDTSSACHALCPSIRMD
jgi:hypothetical protein